MSITFNDLLTEPKYREMSEDELKDIVCSFDWDEMDKSRAYFNLIPGNSLSFALFNHLQKLKAESEKKAEPNYGESPIISHINAIQMGALIEKVAKEFNKPVRLETLTKEEHPIQITDQKAREICAKYFNDCNPNEIKIV